MPLALTHWLRLGYTGIVVFGLAHVGHAQQGDSAHLIFRAERFRGHVQFLASDDLAGRLAGSDGGAKAREYVTRHFAQSGLQPLDSIGRWHQDFPTGSTEASTIASNILGLLPGKGDLKEEAILLCAHYDHLGTKQGEGGTEDVIFNGAADNASGVAALLMMAESLAAQNSDSTIPRRSVIFACFDAEELGLKGARHYAEHPLWPLEKTVVVINLDDIGHLRGSRIYASDAETSQILAETCRTAARKFNLTAATWLSGRHRSDHAVFLGRQIPSTHLFTGLHPHYHRVSDEWETLNHDGGARVARFAAEIVEQLAIHDATITYRQPKLTQDLGFAMGVMRTIGVVPNLGPQDGQHPQILFVIPGSPAARHGLRSADRIAELDGFELERPEDALRVLPVLDFEDGISLSVLRRDEPLKIQLPAKVFHQFAGPRAVLQENGKYLVSFVYKAKKGVKRVFLAGDFNDWNPTSLARTGPDAGDSFTIQIELEQGFYQYKFVIEGDHWVPDPTNMFQTGNHKNCILRVGNLQPYVPRE